jgi:hypothetical protein
MKKYGVHHHQSIVQKIPRLGVQAGQSESTCGWKSGATGSRPGERLQEGTVPQRAFLNGTADCTVIIIDYQFITETLRVFDCFVSFCEYQIMVSQYKTLEAHRTKENR